MRLFHFTSKKHGLSSVTHKRLKIAELKQLNDPYEFYVNFCNGDTQSSDEVIEEIKNDFNQKMGVLCFSKRSGDPVQWGHYSDKHQGICLEFEVNTKYLIKIKYVKKPMRVDVNTEDWWNMFIDATQAKFYHWRYEKEYRLIVDLKSNVITTENNLKFIGFGETLTLKGVYLGCNCKLGPLEEIVIAGAKVPVYKTRKSRDMFLIEKA